MASHVTTLLVVALDALALLAIALPGIVSLRIVLGWAPGSTEPAQQSLARWAGRASLASRAAAAAFLVSTALLIVSIASVLPRITEGVMCGTGVLGKMAGEGEPALLLRGVACALLAAFAVLDRLNRRHPSRPIAVGVARAQLLAATLTVVAVVQTASALIALDPEAEVSCCGALYKAAAAAGESFGLFGRCVWCMFLEKNDHVGYPLLVALAIVVLEGVAVAVAAGVARRVPELRRLAVARARRGAIAIALAVVVFAALVVGPSVM